MHENGSHAIHSVIVPWTSALEQGGL